MAVRTQSCSGFSYLRLTFGFGGLAPSLGRDWGYWVNFKELWVRPGAGLQEPGGRIALLSPLLPVAPS